MDHNPELAQTLPARELHELVTGDQNSAVFAELESLPDSDDATIKKERTKILGRLRGLKLAALKEYREKQKENPQQTAKTAKTKDVGHHRIPFSRIRHLMPVRQRLSESLFTAAAVRSKAGRAVLKDLIGRSSRSRLDLAWSLRTAIARSQKGMYLLLLPSKGISDVDM